MSDNTSSREIKYREAIAEAHLQSMERNPKAFMMGPGIADATGIFGTTKPAAERFGPNRVFDTPTSENTLTGLAVGAAVLGMHPVLIHARNDFMLLTLDQIVNHASKWSYMSGGKLRVPFLIRAIIGRGWGQGAQHSQSLQSIFMHFPGIQVIMPVTPYDAKGMILSAMESDMPVICLEHRWLYDKSGAVPEEYYMVPLGKGRIVREGTDVTIVAVSQAVIDAETAARQLALEGISAEVIDLRSIRPLDTEIILNSVRKTKRLVVCDTSWKTAGVGAEVLAVVAESLLDVLKASPIRLGNVDTPTPFTSVLEAHFYPNADTIARAARSTIQGAAASTANNTVDPNHKPFSGPF